MRPWAAVMECFDSFDQFADCRDTFVQRFDPLSWILLVAGLGYLIRYMRLLLFARRRIGTVEVAELETSLEGDAKPDVKGLTALMRDRLEDCGAMPSSGLPGGSIHQSLVAVVKTSPLTHAGWMSQILSFLVEVVFPTTGHSVRGTVLKRVSKPEIGLTVELRDVYSGATEAIHTFWNETGSEAAERAASYLYQKIVEHTPGHAGTPLWARWLSPRGEGLTHFRRGLLCEAGEGDPAKAFSNYDRAAQLEPMNVLVRFQRANLHEEQGRFLEALKLYLQAAVLWPEVLEARFRLAATYTFEKELLEDWQTADPQERESVKKRDAQAQNKIETPIAWPSTSDAELRDYLLERAAAEWSRLHKDVRWSRLLTRWLQLFWASCFRTSGHRQGASRYYRLLLAPAPWGKRRHKLQRAIESANLCSQLRCGKTFSHLDVVMRRLLAPGVDWQARYNAACFYSLALTRSAQCEEEKLVEKAISELELVVRDPEARIDAWLCLRDPDLDSLRSHHRGRDFFALVGCLPDDGRCDDRALDTLGFAWRVLTDRSQRQTRKWGLRRPMLNDWTCVQLNELEEWCERERIAWLSLAAWASAPEKVSRRERFWNEIMSPNEGDAPKEELPRADAKSEDGTTRNSSECLDEHRKRWLELARCADSVRDRWRNRRDECARARRGADGIELQTAVAWVMEAHDTWMALSLSAEAALEERTWNQFRVQAGCMPGMFERIIDRILP